MPRGPVGILGKVPAVRGLGFAWKQTGFVTPVGPFNQYNWPNPIRVVFRDYGWVYPGNALFPIQPDTTHLPRGPLYAARVRVEWNLSWSQSLLQSTLAPSPIGKGFFDLVPPAPYRPLQITTVSYNLNLVGQDRMVVGEQVTERTPRPYEHANFLRTWTGSYNLNLIGKDALPTGEQTTALAQGRDYPRFLAAWTQNLLQSTLSAGMPTGEQVWSLPLTPPFSTPTWTGLNINLFTPPTPPTLVPRAPLYSLPRAPLRFDFTIPANLVITSVTQPVPFNQDDWPNPRDYVRPSNLGVWTWSYNLNLVGKDVLTVGEQVYDLPPQPAKQPTSIFTATYNKNLVGQDKLPTGEFVYDRPPLAPALLQAWINNVNIALTTVQVIPFHQTDWPLTPAPKQIDRTIAESFNPDLIGQDRLPFRQTEWPNPTQPYRQPQLSSWIDQVKLLLLVPFRQTDWPLTPAAKQPAQSFTGSYNLNLIGQDQLPTGEQTTALPPQPPLSAIQIRTWINSAALALITTPPTLPYNQYDWPVPKGPLQPDRFISGRYNLNLIAKDQLPNGEIVTDLAPRGYPEPATRTWTQSFNPNLRGKDQLPNGDQSYELTPKDYARSIQLRTYAWSYNLNLIGKDRLPVGTRSYDLAPRGPTPLLQTWLQGFSQFRQAIIIPFPHNQYDWPVPIGAWDKRERTIAFRSQLLPPTPPPPPLPNVEAPLIRDFWDMDEWGNIIKGYCVRGT